MVTIHVLYMYIAMAITKRLSRKFHVIYEGCEKNENINSCRDKRHETVYRQRIANFLRASRLLCTRHYLNKRIAKKLKKSQQRRMQDSKYTLEQGLVCERHYCDNYT